MLQDFSNKNLCNQSFRKKNLAGCSFANTDIRGVDFTNANLVGTNFVNAKAGLSASWSTAIFSFSILLIVLSGFVSGYAGTALGTLFAEGSFFLGWIVLATLIVFWVVSILKGLGAALGVVSLLATELVVLFVAITPDADHAGRALLSFVALGGAISGVVGWALSVALGRSSRFVTALAMLGAVVGAALGIAANREIIGVVIIMAAVAILGSYIGTAALKNGHRYSLIYKLAIGISTAKSTCFRDADLTDANFTEAVLENADFRGATLIRTRWQQARKLEKANVGRTYLENPHVMQLVVKGYGADTKFNRLDLRGLNLKGAQLSNASFIGSDLSDSTLQGADLSSAKLVQTQLHRANLSEACLTGAFIQNWGISTETNLDLVQCDYIYMRYPTEDDPDPSRKPDNKQEIFRKGDFSAFIAPIIKTLDTYQKQNVDPRAITVTAKTLDLYHYEGIDPSAAAIAFQRLAEQHPEAKLEVVSLEGRGDERIRVQATVADEANRSELSEAYFQSYSEIKSLPYGDLQQLLKGVEEKDERIRSLEQMVQTALGSNKFYVESYHSFGDTLSEKSSISIQSGGDIGNVSGVTGGDVSGVVNLGKISGDVTNAINQIPDTSTSGKSSLRELLIQLQTAIEVDLELPDEDKTEALEQVKVLAQAGKNPQDVVLQRAAKTATKILKGTMSNLSETSNLVQGCSQLLPLIASLLLLT